MVEAGHSSGGMKQMAFCHRPMMFLRAIYMTVTHSLTPIVSLLYPLVIPIIVGPEHRWQLGRLGFFSTNNTVKKRDKHSPTVPKPLLVQPTVAMRGTHLRKTVRCPTTHITVMKTTILVRITATAFGMAHITAW